MKGQPCRVGGQILLIPLEEIIPNPNQPRERFQKEELQNLAQSIRQNGIIQPIAVRQTDNAQYEIISGERRFRAAGMVGLRRMPCILMEADDEKSALFALIENMQRCDLDFFEEARAIERLLTLYGMSREEVCGRLGKSPPTVSNKLRLLRLSPEIQHKITANGLTERHARALLRLDEEKAEQAMSVILQKHLTVSETERLIERMLQKPEKPNPAVVKLFKDVRVFVNTLNHAVETMKSAGIEAKSEKTETEDFICYTVRIPKNGTCRIGSAKSTG